MKYYYFVVNPDFMGYICSIDVINEILLDNMI